MTNEKETSCIINIYNKRYFTRSIVNNWDDKVVVETVEVITKKFINYMKEQEDLERMGKPNKTL